MVLDGTGKCVCDTGYELAGITSRGKQTCVLSSQWSAVQQEFPLAAAQNMQYKSIVTQAGQGEAEWKSLASETAQSLIVSQVRAPACRATTEWQARC
jgi:hypothetical protein